MKPNTQKFKAEFRRRIQLWMDLHKARNLYDADQTVTTLFGMHAGVEALGLYELAAWCEKTLNEAGLQ